MISASMRYKNFTWHHNPKTLKIKNSKKTINLSYPYSYTEAEEMFNEKAVIEGEGELFGENCIEQFNNLCRLFSSKNKGILSIGGIPSFEAYFTKLELLCEPKNNILSYSFQFTECSSKEKRDTGTNYYIAQSEETLWDISYKCNISIETLAKLNPGYKRPDSVKEGDRVVLC